MEPLVARGDDAADTMLKHLSALLDGKTETAMIHAIRSAFDETKLPAAWPAWRGSRPASFTAGHRRSPQRLAA